MFLHHVLSEASGVSCRVAGDEKQSASISNQADVLFFVSKLVGDAI